MSKELNYIADLERENRLLGERCNQLLKDKGELTDKIAELNMKIDGLEEQTSYMFNEIALQEQQIEKMKCCGNCRFSESDTLNGTFCHREGCFVVASAKCKLWEM